MADQSRAIQLKPQHASAYFHRSLTYAIIGEYEAVIEEFSQAIQLNTHDNLAYVHRGVVCEKLCEKAKANAGLHQALQVSDDPTIRAAAQEKPRELGVEP